MSDDFKITRTFLERADYSIFKADGNNIDTFIPLNNERILYEIELPEIKIEVVVKGEQSQSHIIEHIKQQTELLIKLLERNLQ